MTWYGQNELDKEIASLFPDGYVGNAVEVGVANGIKGSNTFHFEDEKGWDVLCIEPIPEYVELAKKVRKKVFEGACTNLGYGSKTKDKFYVFNIGENQILSSLSGLKPDPKLLTSHGNLINECYTIEVYLYSLNNILTAHSWPRNIDFISIDTEGTELDVLKGLDLWKWNVKYLVVENNHEDKDVEEYLKYFQYIKISRNFVNDIYKRDSK